jgi:DNA-directed RNA polymerase specialized sigma24 family protein
MLTRRPLDVDPRIAFDDWYSFYKKARRMAGSVAGSALGGSFKDVGVPGSNNLRARGNRYAEAVADFSQAGYAALLGSIDEPKRRTFEHYHLKGNSFNDTCTLLNQSVTTVEYWIKEIRKRVGLELLARHLWPVGLYFRRTKEFSPGEMELLERLPIDRKKRIL